MLMRKSLSQLLLLLFCLCQPNLKAGEELPTLHEYECLSIFQATAQVATTYEVTSKGDLQSLGFGFLHEAILDDMDSRFSSDPPTELAMARNELNVGQVLNEAETLVSGNWAKATTISQMEASSRGDMADDKSRIKGAFKKVALPGVVALLGGLLFLAPDERLKVVGAFLCIGSCGWVSLKAALGLRSAHAMTEQARERHSEQWGRTAELVEQRALRANTSSDVIDFIREQIQANETAFQIAFQLESDTKKGMVVFGRDNDGIPFLITFYDE